MKTTSIKEAFIKSLRKTGKSFLFQDKQIALGTIFKKIRLRKNLTQQEFSEGICSYSYESKIEANKITPNEKCIYMLCSKHDINKDEIYLVENSNELLNEAYDYYYDKDINSYKDLFNRVKDVDNNQFAATIKTGYYILTNQFYEAEKIVYDYYKTINSFNPTAMYLFSLFTSEVLYFTSQFKDSLEIAEELIRLNIDNKINIMSKEIIFKNSIALNRTAPGVLIYKELLDHYVNTSSFSKIDDLKLNYLELIFNSKEYNYFISVEKNMVLSKNSLKTEKLNYMKGIAYYRIKDFVQAREYLNKLKDGSIYYKLSLFEKEFLYNGSKKEFLNKIIELNKKDPSFYYMYFIKEKNNQKDGSIFKSHEYNIELSRSNLVDKINLLNLELKQATLQFKYKEAVKIYERIKEVEANK